MDIKLTKEELIKFLSNKSNKETKFGGEGNPWDKFGELITEQNKIYEGLIESYPIETVEKKINKEFPNLEYKIFELDYKSKYLLVWIDKGDNPNNLIKTMDTYGWFLSSPLNLSQILKANNSIKIQLKFEAKFDVDVTHNFSYKKPLVLGHLTPAVNLDKIMKNGLSPKSNSKLTLHPDRIYFFTQKLPIDKVFQLVQKLYAANPNDPKYKDKYALLDVTLNHLQTTPEGFTGPRIKFFTDPNAADCVYTMENIHPKDIKVKLFFSIDSKGNITDIEEPL